MSEKPQNEEQAESAEKDSSSKPTMWKCGEAYQYPIPKPDGNPWEIVLEALLKKDKVQCDAWKDEVQNLLIFAGLFSAVVTSFVVQSYQSLRPDSGDLTVVLLARLVSQLGDAANTTTSLDTLVSPSPASSSDIRVNTFWFLSLVLSLTTVLIGIVSLQWLREHQRYSESLSPRLALGIFQMRSEALEKCGAHSFFAGIIDFLIELSPRIAIPVAVVTGLTVSFIIATTALPTLQCFPVSLRRPLSNSSVPVPCPYKSPQSLAFRRLATFSPHVFKHAHDLIVRLIFWLTIHVPSLLNRLLLRGPYLDSGDTWRHRIFSNRAYLFWASQHWIEFDRTWLILRNEHFDITRTKAEGDRSTQSLLSDPIYDSVRALGTAIHGNEHHENVIFASYHCFQDLSLSPEDDGEYPDQHLQACYRDLVPTWNSPIANIASIVIDPSFELLHDIHTVLFLRLPGLFYKAINPSHVFGKHMLELHTRILGDLYAHQPRTLSTSTLKTQTGFFHWYTINMASLHFDPDMQDAFFEQFFMIFDSFVRTTVKTKNVDDILNTFHTHSDLDDFISLAAYLTWRTTQTHIGCDKKRDGGLKLLLSALNRMSSALIDYTSVDRDPGIPDFVFCCSALYLKRVWQEKPRLATFSTFSPVILELSTFFGAFHRDILLPYESQLDEDRFIRIYGSFVNERSLPRRFFNPENNFERFAKTVKSIITADAVLSDESSELNEMVEGEDRVGSDSSDLRKSNSSFRFERFNLHADALV
ncbi:hypothetical protein CVT25_004417 [Psilocybe cyanescens]|uniref:DUF6535 domain-containing protein n=1 Tax=Psilocybe cyanescens TaxID=93625 RepID=A0A409XW11_PSICY|nr:hypothetical protein CVT25_004417 [Psilocybe cyanescens]